MKPVVAPRLLEEFQVRSGTCKDLATATGFAVATVRQIITGQFDNLVFISGWRRPERQGSIAPIYTWGHGVTPEKPGKLGDAVYQQRHRERNPHSQKLRRIRYEERKAQRHVASLAPARPWVEAFLAGDGKLKSNFKRSKTP